MTGRLLTPDEAAGMLGITVKTLANKRSTGGGPKYVKLGPPPADGHRDNRPVRYTMQALADWMESMGRTRPLWRE